MLNRKYIILTILALTQFLLSACSLDVPPGPAFSDEVKASTNQVLMAFLEGNKAEIDDLVLKEFTEIENYDSLVTQIIERLDGANSKSARRVLTELRQNDTSAGTYPIYRTVFEIERGENFVALQLFMADRGECCRLQHILFDEMKESPSLKNNFTFQNKGIWHYLFFGLIIIIPIFILFTLVFAAFDKRLKRKWLWLLLIAFGFWGFSINWTSGDINNLFVSMNGDAFSVSFFKINLLGAGFSRSGILAPWILEIGIPIAAIIYWYKRVRRTSNLEQDKELEENV